MNWLLKIPGFRSGKMIPMIASAMGYFAIIMFFTLGRTGIVYGATLLAFVLFAGNLGGLRDRMPLFGSENPWVRRGSLTILGLLLWYLAARLALAWDPSFLS